MITYEGFIFNRKKPKSEQTRKPNISKSLLESTFSDLVDSGFTVKINAFYTDQDVTYNRSGEDDTHNLFNVNIWRGDEFDKDVVVENLLFVEPYIRCEFGYDITSIIITDFYSSDGYKVPYKDFIKNDKKKLNIPISDIVLYIKKIR